MDLGLRGKRALVTAASRGLGLASGRALAGEGAKVALGARNVARLDAIAKEFSALGDTDVFAVDLDLTPPLRNYHRRNGRRCWSGFSTFTLICTVAFWRLASGEISLM